MPPSSETTGEAKQAIRERVWAALEDAGAAEPGVRGHIPDFAGSRAAADRLAALPAWKNARVLKIVPDRAQLPVRARALAEGKLIYMPAPRLATPKPFYVLDPRALTASPAEAAEHQVAARIAPMTGTAAMQPLDLIVVGSVAVNERGARLGKGAGYSDIELALATEAGLVSSTTVIATTVHELQVLDQDLPEADHDFRVDLIVTPDRATWCNAPKRPAGLDWESLSPAQIAAIPALRQATMQNAHQPQGILPDIDATDSWPEGGSLAAGSRWPSAPKSKSGDRSVPSRIHFSQLVTAYGCPTHQHDPLNGALSCDAQTIQIGAYRTVSGAALLPRVHLLQDKQLQSLCSQGSHPTQG